MTSREWYLPNPPLPTIDWGPRNNTNIQESALLFALNRVATDHQLYLENYWIKNKHAIETGRTGAVNAWLIPANQQAKLNVINMVDDLRHQGIEVSTADSAFTAGGLSIERGDYVIRADQPYRTLADMYLSVQNYPASNPKPYDDTGWTMQYLRNVTLWPVHDPSVLTRPMTLLTSDTTLPGTISGSGATIVFNHTGDNQLVELRFRLKGVRMLAAEQPFDAGGKHYTAGSFILPHADYAAVAQLSTALGITGEAIATMPSVRTHPLTAPRIGYMHSWASTQDEGWWRAAFDRYGIPYTYFADTKARLGGLRKKYDVLIYPTAGSSARDEIAGVPMAGPTPMPYRKSALTPNLGVLDSSEDIRGGLGGDGAAELRKFVEAGGILLGDGSTVEMLAELGIASRVTVSKPARLYTKGAIMRGVLADRSSPIAYGYAGKEMPVYFLAGPVLTVDRSTPIAGGYFETDGPGAGLNQNVIPNATSERLSTWSGSEPAVAAPPSTAPAVTAPSASAPALSENKPNLGPAPRVVMQFPDKADDILLSGLLSGGQALVRRPLVIDVPAGRGHMVLFALRPFWRWQTQGSYFLAFNALLNWDHLDAGSPAVASK